MPDASAVTTAATATSIPGAELLDAAQGFDDHTIELRREIHKDPELGLQLPRTQQRILDSLTGLGLDITTGESTTSVVADLDTGRPGPTVLLRGDMDALPLTEDFDSEFKSQVDGAMHACGHDAHVAMLASAAHFLAEHRDELTGRVRFMFQPGEEGFHGARHMIEEGVLDGVDRAFAIHVITNMPNGMILTKGGPLMASADTFEITIHGEGGHASAPHHCIDPIPAMAATITGLHTMIGRTTDPALSGLVTVGQAHAGTTNNIIPPTAYLNGTIRALDEGTRARIHEGIITMANGTAQAHRCGCDADVIAGYPVTVNDIEQAALTGVVASSVLGPENYLEMPRALLGAEDWSYVLQQVPGSMAFLGVTPDDLTPEKAAPNHSNLMRISESKLSHGVALYAAMAMVH